MTDLKYHVPHSLEEALGLLEASGEDGRLIAGGTALAIMLQQGLIRKGHLIDLSRLDDLYGIVEEDSSLRIGALTTHRDLEVSSSVARHFPALVDTMHTLATVRIRNIATLGGNIAHGDPALDPPVTLTALGAQVKLVGREEERLVPLDEFFVDYYETVIKQGEILTQIILPLPQAHSASAFVKFMPRTADDYATVAVGVWLALDESTGNIADVRIGLGSLGPTTIRARLTEEVIRGESATVESIRDAAAAARSEVDPIADIRGSRDYKIDMTEVFVRRALERATALLRE